MRKLVILTITAAVLVVAAAVILFATTTPEAEPAGNIVYIYDDGSAQVHVDYANKIQQTHEDLTIDGTTYLAGTLIIPGNGSEIYYNYPQRDSVRGE